MQWQDAATEHHIVAYDDENYPPLLKEIKGSPPVIFVRGDPELLRFPSFAIVGPRKPSREGLRNARNFGRYISQQGVCIVSGLAYGIDKEAHESSLGEQGKTVAVVGTGIDITYPRLHKELQEKIVRQGGAIVSSFARGTIPMPYNFPARNRIISGMSLGVLVVEAGFKSGAMITARYATEQGREVFAIPGSIHYPLAKGTNSLIKQGANLVESYEDIVAQLPPIYQRYREKLAAITSFSAASSPTASGSAPAITPVVVPPPAARGSVAAITPAAAHKVPASVSAPVVASSASPSTAASAAASPATASAVPLAGVSAPAPTAAHKVPASVSDLGSPVTASTPAAPPTSATTTNAKRLVKLLQKGALSPDEISEITGITMDELNSELTILELEGLIYQEKGIYHKH